MKLFFTIILCITTLFSRDFNEIKESGYIKHIGVPYANFVTGFGDGLDVELIKGFAKYIGVEYKYVNSNWNDIIDDLDKNKGDLIANGLTILPWREKRVNFSIPTFPSSVWLLATADSDINPIVPTTSLDLDIKITKNKIDNKSLLTRENTCLDASLYNIDKNKTQIILHSNKKGIIEMVPSILLNKADATLMDVPDALLALEKWSGQIKVIGPISKKQKMAVAFPKKSTKLLEVFNNYLIELKKSGDYNRLVAKYYPSVFNYYKDFFR